MSDINLTQITATEEAAAHKRAEEAAAKKQESLRQQVARRMEDAKRFVTYAFNGSTVENAPTKPKETNWNVRIEVFILEDGRPKAWNVLTRAKGSDKVSAVEHVLAQLKEGQITFR